MLTSLHVTKIEAFQIDIHFGQNVSFWYKLSKVTHLMNAVEVEFFD